MSNCKNRCVPCDNGFYRAYTEVDGNNLIINLKGICPTLIIQGDKLSFAICNCIEYPQKKISDVFLDINGTRFQLMKFGAVKWDQIKPRTCYNVILGTEEPSATVCNTLPCSKFNYPEYTTNCSTYEKAV